MGISNLPALWEKADLYLSFFFFFLCVPFKENAYNQVIFVSPPVKLLKCQEELLAMGTDSILIWPESNLLFTGLHAGVQ